ncbi:MAG: hypothetical protein ACHREM_24340 [Polyangiales bacterium]
MTTKPHSDIRSIAVDARRILDAARADLANASFKKYVSKSELDGFEANIVGLESGDGARTARLHSQVEAGVHAAQARAAVITLLSNIRDDVKIHFPDDHVLHRAFGVGARCSGASTAEVRHLADVIVESVHEHPKAAGAVGLDIKGLHKFEDLIHALDGADLAHVHAVTSRHQATTGTDSLAHLVSAEVAHLRLVARRVFRADEEKLARYDRTLPRHAVVPRSKAAAPSAPTAQHR